MASNAKKKVVKPAAKPAKAAAKSAAKSSPAKGAKAVVKTAKAPVAKAAKTPVKAAPAPKPTPKAAAPAAKATAPAKPVAAAAKPAPVPPKAPVAVPQKPVIAAAGKPVMGKPAAPPVLKVVKPPVKMEVPFAQGDYVVYPTHGVGKVQSIEKQSIAGIELELFVITFDRDRMTLRVPVPKARQSGLRKLSSRSIMDSALNTLKGRARVKRTMWSRRAQEYEAKINSGDPVAIAEVVRDLHRHANQPDQSYSERQIYEAALERLASELAAVEGVERDKATQKLETLLDAA
ncbi:MAG TPA: CarD family transcriptional regulator [Magnetospirillaceae bacterium]|jgi:CarD family transcriptional regulator